MVQDPYHGAVPFACQQSPLWIGGAVLCWVVVVAIAAYTVGRQVGRR
jgi:hypothetical protein